MWVTYIIAPGRTTVKLSVRQSFLDGSTGEDAGARLQVGARNGADLHDQLADLLVGLARSFGARDSRC